MMKTVSYLEYSRALCQVQQAAGDMVEIFDLGGMYGLPVKLGVHWAARGHPSPSTWQRSSRPSSLRLSSWPGSFPTTATPLESRKRGRP